MINREQLLNVINGEGDSVDAICEECGAKRKLRVITSVSDNELSGKLVDYSNPDEDIPEYYVPCKNCGHHITYD